MNTFDEDDKSMIETAYLLKNPVMAERLLKAAADVKAGKVEEHALINEQEIQ